MTEHPEEKKSAYCCYAYVNKKIKNVKRGLKIIPWCRGYGIALSLSLSLLRSKVCMYGIYQLKDSDFKLVLWQYEPERTPLYFLNAAAVALDHLTSLR